MHILKIIFGLKKCVWVRLLIRQNNLFQVTLLKAEVKKKKKSGIMF